MPTAKHGAFAQHARALFDVGLAPIPTGGADGKRPLRRGYNKKPLSPERIEQLSMDLGDANLALVCGFSKLNVVDVDAPALLPKMLKRFGDTPLITKTGGRGGFQLFYRAHRKVRPIDLRQRDQIEVEIKADGNIVIVPPSVNRQTGRAYTFHAGDWSVLPQLPRFNIEALIDCGSRSSKKIEQGERANWLFRQCLKHAPACDDLDALVDVAFTRAAECFGDPLPDGEIEKAASSAWGYEQRGENWSGRKAHTKITTAEVKMFTTRDLSGGALTLYLLLMNEHGARLQRGEPFRLVTGAMEAHDTLPGWTDERYQRAIRVLLDLGVLVKVRQGCGRGYPSLFTIASAARFVSP